MNKCLWRKKYIYINNLKKSIFCTSAVFPLCFVSPTVKEMRHIFKEERPVRTASPRIMAEDIGIPQILVTLQTF